MRDCSHCKFCDEDYVYDDEIEDEYSVLYCEKGNDTSLDDECKDFKKYKPKKHIEKDTKCDNCKYLSDCIARGNVIDCRTISDERSHYTSTFCCKKKN